MKRLNRCLATVFVMAWFSGVTYAGNTAGVFQLPFDISQRWSACTTVGYKFPADQIFMQFYAVKGKYHLAEDWNGICGRSTDKYGPLYAIAEGVVVSANMTLSQGGFLLIRHDLPDVTSRYVLYEHVNDIFVAEGQRVHPDRTPIATIGDGNGSYPNAAHLHFEMRRDNLISLYQNPYYNPLEVRTALKYTSPSLFIDDRRYPFTQSLANGAYTYIKWYANAPSSTAFVEYNGERYSLKRAVQLGYIYQYVYEQRSGSWYYYPDIANVFFGNGNTYAVWSFVNGAVINILIPGNNYKDDRAKIDMMRAVSADRNFINVEPDVYVKYYSDQWYDYYYMKFIYNNGSGNQIVYANQATSKSNPLVRYTTYYNPVASQWTVWTQVNQNTLD